MLFTHLYSGILGKEEQAISKKTNEALIIPETLVHQQAFPTILLNSRSFTVTPRRLGD
jgi:hypothetical protein